MEQNQNLRVVCYILMLGISVLLLIKMKVHTSTLKAYPNWDPFLTITKKDFVSVPIDEIMSGNPTVLEQDDKKIINYIWKNRHLEPPSTYPYNLEKKFKDPSRGQGQFIQKIFRNMTNGFFVECGALDGESRSNTLFLEQHLGWKGLLVEGDPSNFALLKKKNRKAWISNTCLAIKNHPHHANFIQQFSKGRVLDASLTVPQNGTTKTTKVQCMPLFSLLSALNETTVDYFSLDVEGSELKILKTIPFHKILIKSLSVEFSHTHEGKVELLKLMKRNGYRVAGEVHYPYNFANDIIFVHKSVPGFPAAFLTLLPCIAEFDH